MTSQLLTEWSRECCVECTLALPTDRSNCPLDRAPGTLRTRCVLRRMEIRRSTAVPWDTGGTFCRHKITFSLDAADWLSTSVSVPRTSGAVPRLLRHLSLHTASLTTNQISRLTWFCFPLDPGAGTLQEQALDDFQGVARQY